MLDTELVRASDRGSCRLMVVLHGLGDSMAGYRWLPQTLGISWLNYLLVNAPTPFYGGYSWYDFAGDPGPGVEISRKHLVHLLDAQRDAGFPTGDTVLFGFSQGCLLAIEVALRYPHRFAGVIGISGYVFNLPRLLHELSPAARQQQLLITHGTGDALIPIAPVRRDIEQLQAAGLQIQWHEFDKDHGLAGEEELQVIRAFLRACYSTSK